MDNARFRFLFQRYIEQKCTEEERSELFFLIEASDNDDTLRSLMDTQWQSTSQAPLSREKADAIFDKIVSTAPRLSTSRAEKNELPGRSSPIWQMAAAIALLIVSGLSTFYFIHYDERRTNHALLESGRIEKTGSEHMFVKLPDGSTVLLNAGSTLDYSGSFDATREVTLTGEGYFDIVHDPLRPFIVHTGNLKTTVLGTAFNIKAYAADNDITVTVTRGKVKVSDEDQEIGIILPDEQITFNGKNKKSEKKSVDSHKAVAWAENDIFFNELTMGEAIRQLEDRFNVRISFEKDELKDCRFTATFIQNESIEQILEVICEFNNATYKKGVEGDIIISGNGC